MSELNGFRRGGIPRPLPTKWKMIYILYECFYAIERDCLGNGDQTHPFDGGPHHVCHGFHRKYDLDPGRIFLFRTIPVLLYEVPRAKPVGLHEIPSCAPRRRSSAVCKNQGFGGLSAGGEIRRSSDTSVQDWHRYRSRVHPRAKPVVFCVGG